MKKSEPDSPIVNLTNGCTIGGLTRREYFAGLAMQALISGSSRAMADTKLCAQAALEHADALLNALNK